MPQKMALTAIGPGLSFDNLKMGGEVEFETSLLSLKAEEASKGTLTPAALKMLAEILARSNESRGLPSMPRYASQYLE